MNIQEIIKSGANVNFTVNAQDLNAWGKELIESTRRELEEVVMSSKMETYPSPKQVSEIMGVNLVTLWRWANKGYLVPIEFGGGRRYKMSEVKALMNGGRV